MEYQLAVTVYKNLEFNPYYKNKLFSYTKENHSYGTRNALFSLLTVAKCNKSIGQKRMLGMAYLKQTYMHQVSIPKSDELCYSVTLGP